jgi:hypothetical protein
VAEMTRQGRLNEAMQNLLASCANPQSRSSSEAEQNIKSLFSSKEGTQEAHWLRLEISKQLELGLNPNMSARSA